MSPWSKCRSWPKSHRCWVLFLIYGSLIVTIGYWYEALFQPLHVRTPCRISKHLSHLQPESSMGAVLAVMYILVIYYHYNIPKEKLSDGDIRGWELVIITRITRPREP